jgi:hypothetical protein
MRLRVTEIRCDVENNGLSAPVPREDALLVTLQLKCCPAHDLWIDGKPAKTGPLSAGAVSINDLRASPIVNSISTFHNSHFYFPRAALNAINEAEGSSRCGEFAHNPARVSRTPSSKGWAVRLVARFSQIEGYRSLS